MWASCRGAFLWGTACLAQVFAKDQLVEILTPYGMKTTGGLFLIYFFLKTEIWRVSISLAFITVIAGLLISLREVDESQRFEIIWPISFLVVPLFMPVCLGLLLYYTGGADTRFARPPI